MLLSSNLKNSPILKLIFQLKSTTNTFTGNELIHKILIRSDNYERVNL